MVTDTKLQVINIIGKNGTSRPADLTLRLGISPQALHRHLLALVRDGLIKKVGSPPQTRYQLESKKGTSIEQTKILSDVGTILGTHPAVLLVTLFGSWARKQANPNSDIDFLVWLSPHEHFNRHDIWNFWDRQTRHLEWNQKVSLVTRKLRHDLTIDTLLLDMPEEHIAAFDRKNYFEILRNAVIQWRKENGAVKIRSFGGKHAWKYSTKVNRLEQINFALKLSNVP